MLTTRRSGSSRRTTRGSVGSGRVADRVMVVSSATRTGLKELIARLQQELADMVEV